MGRKRARKRKHLLFHIAGFFLTAFGIAACNHLPVAWLPEHRIEDAQTLMSKGDYDGALRVTEAAQRRFPETMGDEALYLRGIIYAHPQNPNSNRQRSMESFQILIKEYPKSTLVQASEVCVSLLQKIRDENREIAQLKKTITEKQLEIEDLRTQIDELKKIDLGIE